ncbi:formylglycine-generating enzyme family protein [Mesorhizobium sp. ASY16-5R]|uniref:formylglycine-generating enzyme family protein n=1 Tax=Mesorhizobium sp. ASY16-5R TaxID=3445772 RepID=UPI003FA05387
MAYFITALHIWEWTADPFRYTTSSSASCCGSPNGKALSRVIKGGSFLCAENVCQRYRSAARHRQDASTSTSHIGFRCVLRSST